MQEARPSDTPALGIINDTSKNVMGPNVEQDESQMFVCVFK